MITTALTHGYPPLWNMGGEVSLHRTMKAIPGEKYVLTDTKESYVFEYINVNKINTKNVLDINTDYHNIAKQLKEIGTDIVIGQNELSLPAVRAAQEINAISVVNVHTPPRYGRGIKDAMILSDYAIYNTLTAAKQWGEPNALVVHPPISPLPNQISNNGDAYTLLSSLTNKGVTVMLDLAKRYPDQRFIIVRSPAEPTHGLSDLEERVAKLPNIELHPRVSPENVYKYLEQTRILFVPSRYETYGMSAIEAAGYGIPSIHVDTPHVREGIGEAAILIPPLSLEGAIRGIKVIEKRYDQYSKNARLRAEWLHERQDIELEKLANFMTNLQKPLNNELRQRSVMFATRKYF